MLARSYRKDGGLRDHQAQKSYGYWENVDRPVPDCECKGCSGARGKERGGRRGGRRDAGKAAEGIIIGMTALSGMGAQPPADAPYQAADAYDQARSGLVDNRDEYLDEQTRAGNDRKGGSSRRR